MDLCARSSVGHRKNFDPDHILSPKIFLLSKFESLHLCVTGLNGPAFQI